MTDTALRKPTIFSRTERHDRQKNIVLYMGLCYNQYKDRRESRLHC